jgi:CBS domain-containing protein
MEVMCKDCAEEAITSRGKGQPLVLAIDTLTTTPSRRETVTPYHTFGQVLDSVIHGYQEDFPVVDENGKLVGMITREEIMAAAHSPERYQSVRDHSKTPARANDGSVVRP